MTTGMHLLDLGLVAAVFVGIFFWMYALTSRSHAKRKEQRLAKTHPRQQWDPNTYEGRRNR